MQALSIEIGQPPPRELEFADEGAQGRPEDFSLCSREGRISLEFLCACLLGRWGRSPALPFPTVLGPTARGLIAWMEGFPLQMKHAYFCFPPRCARLSLTAEREEKEARSSKLLALLSRVAKAGVVNRELGGGRAGRV